VKLNVPFAGSIPFHGMSISTLFRPSALSAVKLAVDHGVPLLSKSSWVDHSVPSHGGAVAAVAVDVVSTPVPVSTAAAAMVAQSSGTARLRNRCVIESLPGSKRCEYRTGGRRPPEASWTWQGCRDRHAAHQWVASRPRGSFVKSSREIAGFL